jgi:uncharacterized protein YbaR (Trm112 family)
MREVWMSFDVSLLEGMLVCTKCRSALVRDGDNLVCAKPDCRRQFALRDEIPNMLVEDSQVLEQDAWSATMRRSGRDATTGAKAASS